MLRPRHGLRRGTNRDWGVANGVPHGGRASAGDPGHGGYFLATCPRAGLRFLPVDFFTADLHLAHSNLAGLHGFDTVAAHDAAVLAPL
jgi:hypothetical protein